MSSIESPQPPEADDLSRAVARIREPLHLVRAASGHIGLAAAPPGPGGELTLLASLPPLYPEWLGDRSFLEAHGVRFPYVVGEMAGGIASPKMVIAAGEAGLLGFFGSAGLPLAEVEAAIDQIEGALGPRGLPWGVNLIHTPGEPELERALVDFYLARGVQRVSASAFMGLTPNVVRFSAAGLGRDPAGRITRRTHLFAKISRPEVARPFLSPAPPAMLAALVEQGLITPEAASLAAHVPVAEDVTVEADSGGHTDNRPMGAVFPAVLAVRNQLVAERGYRRPVRVGAAGGLGTPAAVASAFSMGAAYVLTGSINQASVEARQSPAVKELLARAGLADVAMCPSSDMFELGVKVQVLKRGTLFASRAARLHEVYTRHPSVEAIPAEERARLEEEIFQRPLDEVWADTAAYFQRRDPHQLERAAQDPRHRLALVCRWYLGQSSRWAVAGEPQRRMDYQVWCGAAMGSFNAWVAGSYLEPLPNRTVAQMAFNLLEGAAVITRAHQCRVFGVAMPAGAYQFTPRRLR